MRYFFSKIREFICALGTYNPFFSIYGYFLIYVIVKFEYDGYVLPTATLRAETVFGVTNLWVNPDIIYEKITIDGEKWIVSPECADKLSYLGKK